MFEGVHPCDPLSFKGGCTTSESIAKPRGREPGVSNTFGLRKRSRPDRDVVSANHEGCNGRLRGGLWGATPENATTHSKGGYRVAQGPGKLHGELNRHARGLGM